MQKTCLIPGLLLVASLLLSPVATKALAATQVTNEASYRATLFELIETLQQQILVLQQELERRLAESETPTAMAEYIDAIDVVAEYEIRNPSDVENITNQSHRDYFERMYELMPAKYGDKITQLQVFTGESLLFDAFVMTLPPKHDLWQYSVRDEALIEIDSIPTAELIVHELGHLVSLEAQPGQRNRYNENCSSYFERNSCPPLNSYLDEFTKEFWSEADLQKAKSFTTANDTRTALENHYEQNSDNYVTEYSALGPEEDFAEAFMYFVMEYETDGEIANQKIDFFEQYTEIDSIREYVLERL